jgi:uncharacterized protein (DUF885 family)
MAEAEVQGNAERGEAEIVAIGAELFAFWARTDTLAASMLGRTPERIGASLQADSDETAAMASRWLHRLDGIKSSSLPRPVDLTRRYLRFELERLVEAGQLHRFDLQITPYRIGIILADVHRFAESFCFDEVTDLDSYHLLVHQYRAFLTGTIQNLREQVSMGIIVPRAALPGCLDAIKGISVSFDNYLRVAPERLSRVREDLRRPFAASIEREIEDIRERFSGLCAYVEGEYTPRAPETCGLAQYRGGDQAYAMLIRHHTSLELSADEVHRRGVNLVKEIEAEMSALRASLGFKGSGRELVQRLARDPRFYCETPEAVDALYARLMKRCEDVLPKAFGTRSFPPYGLRRLPMESAGGMTFGYYQPSVPGSGEIGCYVYNASNLDQRPMMGAASLIYHELVPGHHLHLATEMGDATRPWVRRFPTITAFNEGWAEYAADLGFELGLYEDHYDRYGRYLLQVFMASRLVVDSGINALGWTLGEGREYMREHTALSRTEIETELARYGSGMPGQALAYALGRQHFWLARRAAESRLGSQFDLPTFHSAILDAGSLPLTDLGASIESWVDTLGSR